MFPHARIALLLLAVCPAACTETYIPCQEHWNCPDDMVCDQDRCIPDDGRMRVCSDDLHCRVGLGERCRNGLCTLEPACASDADCPADQFCHGISGDCRPCSNLVGDCHSEPQPCQTDGDCPPGTACDPGQGTCQPAGCGSDADCPAGQVCQPDSQTCGSRGTDCQTDADCLAGQRCDTLSGVCRAGACVTDADCLAGQYCDRGPGLCRYPGQGCASDADCPAGSWCDPGSGDCSTGCRSDADCPDGTHCDPAGGECLTPTGCVTDGDCPAGHTCRPADGTCLPVAGQVPDGSPCETNDDCAHHNCVPITRPAVCLSPCRSSAGCPAGWACSPVTSANYCVSQALLSQLRGVAITVGSGEYGDFCSGQAVYNPYCHSLICHQNLGICTTDCTSDADCARVPGSICRLNYETGIMRAYCVPDPGLSPPGYSCDDNYFCSLGVCFAGVYACAGGCCSSLDCPAGWACGRMQSDDPQAPGYAKVCYPTDQVGASPTGAACSADAQCRSGLCLAGACSDLCCSDLDCPQPLHCALSIDANNLAVTLCQ